MPQGEPISHVEALRFAIQLAEAEGFPECAAGLRAILGRLTQPTDTQGDLTERARAIVEEFRAYLCNLMIDLDEPEIEWMINKLATVIQSEREAALMDGGEWRTKLAEQIGKTQAAAAEARRAAIAECAQRARGKVEDHADCQHEPGYMDGRLDAADAIEALASPPAPQEEKR